MPRKRERGGAWGPALQVLAVTFLAIVGRRLGLEEKVAAASLAIGATAVLVAHAAQRLKP